MSAKTSWWHEAARRAREMNPYASDEEAAPKVRSIRRDPPPPPAAAKPTEDQLRLRLAEELEYARRMLSTMGDELSSDGLMVSRHIAELQTIDIVGQMLGHIANVVRSSDPTGAVELIGMAELKGRLQRKSLL